MKTDQSNLPSRRCFLEQALLVLSLANFTFADEKIKEKEVTLKIGDKFPETNLLDQNGAALDLSKLSKGKLVLVDFWGVWCGPCLQEIPSLNKAYLDLKDQTVVSAKTGKEIATGFEIYSIAVHLNENHHKKWMDLLKDKRNITWDHNVEAPNLEFVIKNYGVDSFPRNFLIDENGVILMMNFDVQSLKEFIKKL